MQGGGYWNFFVPTLRLVLVDARFFLDKQHPARSLLQAVAQRGLAFGSTDDPLFNAFLLSLQRFVSPLSGMQIENAEPFAHALSGLVRLWDDASARADLPSQIDSAVAALQYAEARNLLADKMVVDMGSIAELHHVPQSVVDFLFGPWAQVMASAQLNDSSRAASAFISMPCCSCVGCKSFRALRFIPMLAPNSIQVFTSRAARKAFAKKSRLDASKASPWFRLIYSVPKLPAQKVSCSVLNVIMFFSFKKLGNNFYGSVNQFGSLPVVGRVDVNDTPIRNRITEAIAVNLRVV